MTSFVFQGPSTTAQTLGPAETGFIDTMGSLVTTTASVTMTGSASLFVMGNANATGNGIFSTIFVDAAAPKSTVYVGADGNILSPSGNALLYARSGTSLFSDQLTNDGHIVAMSYAVRLNTSARTSMTIENHGAIESLTFRAIDVIQQGSFWLHNSGTISGAAGYAAVKVNAPSVTLTNEGTIQGIDLSTTRTSSISVVHNLGTIVGDMVFGDGSDRYYGAAGHVTGQITMGGGTDLVIGGSGDDNIGGGLGNDTMNGSLGADTFYGDLGIDMVSYVGSTAGVDVDLRAGEGLGGLAEGDVLIDVENLRGTSFADILTGNGSDNLLRGGGGADLLQGGDGNDTLRGDQGGDTMIGGNGVDTVTYQGSGAGVRVTLVTGLASGGQANGDQLIEIENVIGSDFIDVLTGNDLANVLSGGAEGDGLIGGRGNDTLVGGIGIGGDTFVFNPSDGADVIADFEKGRDVIDVTAFFFGAFSDISARVTVAANGVDTLVNLDSIIGPCSLTLKNVVFATAFEMEEAFAWN